MTKPEPEVIEPEVLPEPIHDPISFEDDLREILTMSSATIVERMAIELRRGHRPLRVFHLLQAYTQGQIRLMRELDTEPGGGRPRMRRVADVVGDALGDQPEDGWQPGYNVEPGGNLGGLAHQQGAFFREILGQVAPLFRAGQANDRVRKIQSLMHAIETAKKQRRKDTVKQLEEELQATMAQKEGGG